MESDILARLTRWYDRVPSDSAIFGCSSKLLDDAAEEITSLRAELAAAIKHRDEAYGLIRKMRWKVNPVEVVDDGAIMYAMANDSRCIQTDADKRAFLEATRKEGGGA